VSETRLVHRIAGQTDRERGIGSRVHEVVLAEDRGRGHAGDLDDLLRSEERRGVRPDTERDVRDAVELGLLVEARQVEQLGDGTRGAVESISDQQYDV
jgi:hypothetical protein